MTRDKLIIFFVKLLIDILNERVKLGLSVIGILILAVNLILLKLVQSTSTASRVLEFLVFQSFVLY